MNKEALIRQSFFQQADICKSLGSDFMYLLLRGLGEALDQSTKCGRQILAWEGDPSPTADALALRFAGGLHAFVRRGNYPALEPYYKQEVPAHNTTFMLEVINMIAQHDIELLPWLEHAPQTNEVARSSIIYAGLLEITATYKMPISLFELGASGGLNLQVSQFGYVFNGKSFGNAYSPLMLNPVWQGSLPPDVSVNVTSRHGCDLNPLSVQNKKDRERLIAYLWPDQPQRITRVETAIEIAQKDPPKLDKVDAADWVESRFIKTETNGSVKVLLHTIALNYFPQDVKRRIQGAIMKAGEKASENNPLAWLTFEFEEGLKPELVLQTWPGGKRRTLATADPHVYGIQWNGN